MIGFEKLENSLIDVIKEEQAKLGFKEEKIHLYYPLSSLNHFFLAQDSADEMAARLQNLPEELTSKLGEVRVSHKGDRFCFYIPEPGSVYVHENMKENEFIKVLIELVQKHECTKVKLLDLFASYWEKTECQELDNGELVMKMVGAEGRSVDTIEQFRKANVTKLKTVVLYPDGLPKENMSFRQITEEEWQGLASFDAKWEDSFLYEYFEENKFFIVSFKSPVPYSQHVAGNDRLVGGFLWNMPEKDIEQYVRPVWERLHELMLSGGSVHYGRGTNLLPGASFNGVCHLRPKGQNSDDVVRLPNGESITKQCFWLDRHYVAELIRENQKVNGNVK